MVRERKRAHRRIMALGIGASAILHAAVLAWTNFGVPDGEVHAGPDARAEEGLPAPDAIEVVRLAEATPDAPSAEEPPAPSLGLPAEAGGPGEPEAVQAVRSTVAATRADTPAEAADATVEAPPEAPEEFDGRARPVPVDRSSPDLMAAVDPGALGVDLTGVPSQPVNARGLGNGSPDPSPSAPDARPGERAPNGVGEAAGSGDAEDPAEDEGDGGGFSLGDIFRGISVQITGGGSCAPGHMPGPTTVTSINNRDPFGRHIPGKGPGNGPAIDTRGGDPLGSVGRIGGGRVGIGRIGGIGR